MKNVNFSHLLFLAKISCPPPKDAEVTDSSKAFHARAAATGTERLPIVTRRVAGTISADEDDDRTC